jgi:hypothetical protein
MIGNRQGQYNKNAIRDYFQNPRFVAVQTSTFDSDRPSASRKAGSAHRRVPAGRSSLVQFAHGLPHFPTVSHTGRSLTLTSRETVSPEL